MHAMQGMSIDIGSNKHMRVEWLSIIPSEQSSPEYTLKCDYIAINENEHDIRSALNNIPAYSYDITSVNPGTRGGGFQIPLDFEGKSGSWGSNCRRLKVNEVKDQGTCIKTSCGVSKIHCCNVFSTARLIQIPLRKTGCRSH